MGHKQSIGGPSTDDHMFVDAMTGRTQTGR
jgi:hypothetical protein